MLHRRRFILRPAVIVAVLAVGGACGGGGGAGGSTEALCEEARAQSEVFTAENFRAATPEIIGVLRELALQAPTEVRNDFEEVTEASSEAELHRALGDIEEFLAEECGIEVTE